MKSFRKKSVKGLASLLILVIGSWIPCPCHGGCDSVTGGAERSSCPSCSHNGSRQDEQSEPPFENGCCCDQGLCKPALLKASSSQSVEFGHDVEVIRDSSTEFVTWNIHPERKIHPCLHLILPNHRAGFPFPELPSLLI